MTVRLFVSALAFLSALVSPLTAADFVLVEPGVEPAPIIVFKNAPPLTREAATTLADYVEKISGARPQVLDGAPNPAPGRAVWVGIQPEVAALFPGLDLEFRRPEEILLSANENHLLVAGRDRWDPAHLNVETQEGTIVGKQQEYGTANAVYTLLQDKLGVRWLWPGELGEDYAKTKSIRIAPFTHRHHPTIRGRGGVIHYSMLGEKGYGKSHEWTRLQRMQLHSMDMGGGHGFGDWWDRFSKTHPEWFALQPDGTRSGFPEPHNAKLCESNPEIARQWLADVEAKLAADPTQFVFNASPNDGWASGHCVCEKCRAWDHPDNERRLFHWKNQHELHPALSDRDVTFANRLGKLLKERFPDKELYVLMMAYGHSRPAPLKAKPADNVIISHVANFLGRKNLVDDGSTRGDTHREQYAAWSKVATHRTWRPNTGSPAGWQQGLPDISIEQAIRDFKMVAESGCMGIFIDAVWEHWATQGPQFYVMTHLAWDPKQDGAAIMADYYARGFGPAADHVRNYYAAFERTRTKFTDENGYDGGLENLLKIYTPELLDEAAGHLRKAAEAAAADPNPIYAKRVAFVDVGLRYTRLTIENARLMSGYWKKPDEAVAAKVKSNWTTIEKVVAEQPYAINWGPVRSITPRMLGFHPDHPPKKAKKSNRERAKDLDLN
jgi:hypothetical protein